MNFVHLVRERMEHADALFPSRIHSFQKDLVPHVEHAPTTWYDEAYEELDAQGHLGLKAPSFGDVAARLSADGRHYLRWLRDDAA